MGKNSLIEWTDHTFNFWIGCTKVSPGCDHCYAESLSTWHGWAPWGKGNPRQKKKDVSEPLKWNREAIAEGRRQRVFCASLSDVFDQEVDPAWRKDLWGIVRDTSELQWLILTKRPHLILKCLPPDWGTGWKNVCLMTSVENQLWANVRIPQLISVPAVYRGISYEPALGPVKLKPEWCRSLHWVINGGESGGQARPMHPEWARSMRDQCRAAGIAFFFKQWGCWSPDTVFQNMELRKCVSFASPNANPLFLSDIRRRDRPKFIEDNPQMVFMYRTAKQRAGHVLDGQEHRAHPFDLMR